MSVKQAVYIIKKNEFEKLEKKLKEFFGKTYKLRCIVIERNKETSNKPETESRLVQAALERGAKKIDVQ